MHESQSRLWENLVGRSRPRSGVGATRASPRACPALPRRARPWTTFYRGVNAVHPSLIRVEADEATYNLHIILRFELELALLAGALAVDDLPQRLERGDPTGCSGSTCPTTPRACSRTSTGAAA